MIDMIVFAALEHALKKIKIDGHQQADPSTAKLLQGSMP